MGPVLEISVSKNTRYHNRAIPCDCRQSCLSDCLGLGVIHFFRTASWGKILFVTIFFAVILLLTFLAVVFPRVDKTIRAAISFYGSFIYWYFVTTAPILFFFWFAPRVLVMSKTLQWAVFVAWGLLLIFGSLTVFTEKYRNRFFRGYRGRSESSRPALML